LQISMMTEAYVPGIFQVLLETLDPPSARTEQISLTRYR
jgi:hypothetical protein